MENIDRQRRFLFGRGGVHMYSRRQFTDKLNERLTIKRMNHSLMVESSAIHLAVKHNVDPYYAGVAGLMHDLCHCDAPSWQLRYIRACGERMEKEWLAHPQIWHGLTASLMLRREFRVKNKDILNAVRYHTTARAGMSKLEKVVYLADVIALDRDWNGVEEMREICKRDLDEGMREVLRYTVRRLTTNNLILVKETWEAYNEYVANRSLNAEILLQKDI